MIDISFDEANHTYSLGKRAIPSVTQCIKAAGLIDGDWFTDFSRDRGRAVHAASHYIDEGDLDSSSLSPILVPYLTAYEKFKMDTGFEPILIEHRVYHPTFHYAGTLDRQGRMNNGTVLLDLKTGPCRPWIRLQLAAYAGAVEGGSAMTRYGVQLKSDGGYKITTCQVADFHQDFRDFLSCLRVLQLQQEML